MRLVRSRCADGKEIWISYFGPLWGVITVPYLIVSFALFWLAVLFSRVRDKLVTKLLVRASQQSFFILFSILIAGNWFLLFRRRDIHPAYVVAIWLLLSFDALPLAMPRLIPFNHRVSPVVQRFVDCHPLSGSVVVAALLMTLQYLPVFLMVCVDKSHGWPFWSGLAYLYYGRLAGPLELTEHVASHAGKGRLFHARRSLVGMLIWLVDIARRYVLYPINNFPPDYYVLSHAKHHHAEDNAPADWQSVLRYPRNSIIGLANYAFFVPLANGVLPLATLLYFLQRRDWRPFLRTTALCLYQLALYCVLFHFMGRYFFVLLGAKLLPFGVAFLVFTMPWHGLHSIAHPHDGMAATHDPSHLIHHEYPGIHLLDLETLQAKYEKLRARESFGLTRFLVEPDGPLEMFSTSMLVFAALLRCDRTALSGLLMSDDLVQRYRLLPGAPQSQQVGVSGGALSEEEFQRRVASVPDARFHVGRADAWLSAKVGNALLLIAHWMKPRSTSP